MLKAASWRLSGRRLAACLTGCLNVFLSVPRGDDVIFLRQGLGRGAKQPFPSLGTFISTLSQRRDAGGRGLTGGMMGTLTSNQWLRHGEWHHHYIRAVKTEDGIQIQNDFSLFRIFCIFLTFFDNTSKSKICCLTLKTDFSWIRRRNQPIGRDLSAWLKNRSLPVSAKRHKSPDYIWKEHNV